MLKILDYLDDVMYYPILVVVLVLAGLYFTFKTRWLQVRMFPECFRVLMEKPAKEGAISSFQALMVSTASRVGTGNIVGVSTALCLGGYGAVFWMWLIATVGGATAFIESTWLRSISVVIRMGTATVVLLTTLKLLCTTKAWQQLLPSS
jgi:AGCS family alanine or glycine:cation symporter